MVESVSIGLFVYICGFEKDESGIENVCNVICVSVDNEIILVIDRNIIRNNDFEDDFIIIGLSVCVIG